MYAMNYQLLESHEAEDWLWICSYIEPIVQYNTPEEFCYIRISYTCVFDAFLYPLTNFIAPFWSAVLRASPYHAGRNFVSTHLIPIPHTHPSSPTPSPVPQIANRIIIGTMVHPNSS
jgi:hypothetical protein